MPFKLGNCTKNNEGKYIRNLDVNDDFCFLKKIRIIKRSYFILLIFD